MLKDFVIINSFSEYIKNIGVYLVFMSFIIMIIPKNSYKEYINLVMSLILIAIFIEPIYNFISSTNKIDIKEMEDFTVKTINSEIIEVNIDDDVQQNLVLEIYKTSLKKQIENIALSNNLQISNINLQIDNSEELFGEIQNIFLELSTNNISSDFNETKNNSFMNNTNSSFIKINNIKIGEISKNINEIDLSEEIYEDVHNEEINKIINNLKNSISNFYNLSIDNIHINIVT